LLTHRMIRRRTLNLQQYSSTQRCRPWVKPRPRRAQAQRLRLPHQRTSSAWRGTSDKCLNIGYREVPLIEYSLIRCCGLIPTPSMKMSEC
jgi:hypothetical protein